MMTTPGDPAGLAKAQKFDLEKNDAEIILEAEKAAGKPFKRLNKDTYPIRSITLQSDPDILIDAHLNLLKGMKVKVKIANPFADEYATGSIEGFTEDGAFMVIDGRRYSTRLETTRI